MNAHTIWDHLFVFVVFFAHPIYIWRSYPAFVDSVREKGDPARIAGYRETLGFWLAFAAVVVLLWTFLGRSWAELGFRWGDPQRLVLGSGIALVYLGLAYYQMRRLGSLESSAAEDQLGKVAAFIPRTRRGLGWFRAVAVNAGVTEELVYRGFLLWYLEPYVGGAWAAVLGVVLFTLAHAYQGAGNLPALALASAGFVGLYLWTGSLLLPIAVHIAVDLLHGNMLARSLGGPEHESSAVPAMPAR